MTSDEERAIVLAQNAALPYMHRDLRRCYVCLRSVGDCADPERCRSERASYAERHWTAAVEQLERRIDSER